MQRRAQRGRPGQAMVEMALVLVILLAVMLGGIDGLQIMMTQYTVAQAARAAAHQAALIGGPDGENGGWDDKAGPAASGTVAETARVILDSGMLTSAARAMITVTCETSPCRRYSPITVRITYQDEIWVPIGAFRSVRADLSATRAAEQDQQ